MCTQKWGLGQIQCPSGRLCFRTRAWCFFLGSWHFICNSLTDSPVGIPMRRSLMEHMWAIFWFLSRKTLLVWACCQVTDLGLNIITILWRGINSPFSPPGSIPLSYIFFFKWLFIIWVCVWLQNDCDPDCTMWMNCNHPSIQHALALHEISLCNHSYM